MPNSTNIIARSIYKHPALSLDEFNLSFIEPFLLKVSKENKQLFLLGDFNINLLNMSTDPKVSSFLSNLGSHLILPNILLPTRITDNSMTLIDNIFSSISGFESFSGNLLYSISDHLPQFHLLRKPLDLRSSNINIQRKNWKKFDQENFILDFLEINWDTELFHLTNTDLAFETFNTIVQNLINRHVPTVNMTKRELKTRSKPWITQGIIKSISKRNFFFRKFSSTKDPNLKSHYHRIFKTYRNSIVSLIRRSKTNHYSSYFTLHAANMQKVWEGIREIIGSKSSKSTSAPSLNINNNITSDPLTVANSFNDFFTSVADSVRSNIGPTHRHFSHYLSNRNPNSIFLNPVLPVEVLKIINSLSSNKSSGPHSIPIKILNLIKHDLTIPLSFLFNLSFSSGSFPTLLKSSKVIPIFKNKGSPLEVSNYRPISLLSNIEKILEKLMYNRVFNFLNLHKSFFERQFGFLKSHSTSHALISIIERIRKALDDGNLACGVFVDLQKAFDTVDHVILLSKLNHYGIRGITNNWFKCYLSNRSQFVFVSYSKSSIKFIRHGVPQGSVLGPLLFLIYINDLHNSIFSCETFKFADDTHLLHFNSDLLSLCNRVNRDLRSLQTWLRANKIRLNAGKTEFLIFRHHRKLLAFEPFLKIGGKKIFQSTHIKYLGVLIDPHLNWKFHISSLSSKLSRANGILSKLRHYVSTKTLINIYHALFNSHLQYGCQLWGLSNIASKPIFILQKRALRLMTFSNFHQPSSPLFSDLKILKICDLVKSLNICFIHKFLNNKLPSDLLNSFVFKKVDHSHGTRGARMGLLTIPNSNTTTFGIRSFSNVSTAQWNSLQRLKPNSDLSLLPLTTVRKLVINHCLGGY